MTKTLEMTIEGTGRALLLHNAERLLNPFDASNKEKKRLTDKRAKQTDEDRTRVAYLEWGMGWYMDEDAGPYIPSTNIYASLHAAARKTSSGPKFLDAVDDATEDEQAILQYDGPRDLEKLWGEGLYKSPFVDYRPTGQQRIKIMRCRPKLTEWSCTSQWLLDETILDEEAFRRFAVVAGKYVGIGDYRKRFGRFNVVSIEEIAEDA